MNLSEVHKKLTHRDKLEIIVAWELFYGDRHTIGVVPFLDKDKVERSLINRLAEGPNYPGVGSVLQKLGAKVTMIKVENRTAEVLTNTGYQQKCVVGSLLTVRVERIDDNGELCNCEYTFEN